MIVKRSDLLIFMGLTSTLSEADDALLGLVHPLAESALQSWMQQSIEHAYRWEFYPIGQPQVQTDFPLDDIDFRTTVATFNSTGRAGTEFLQLKHTPVITTGLAVYEDVGAYGGQADGSFSDATLLAAGQDYYLDVNEYAADGETGLSRSGILYRIGAWPTEPRSVKIGYYGGFTSIQRATEFGGAVKLATLMTVAAAYRLAKVNNISAGLGPKMSESIGKYSYSHARQFVANSMSFTVPLDAQRLLHPFRNCGRMLLGG